MIKTSRNRCQLVIEARAGETSKKLGGVTRVCSEMIAEGWPGNVASSEVLEDLKSEG
jgi:hypothetical protein